MPRQYKRTVGSRRYCDYSQETLEKCLQAIRRKEISQREAEKLYNIPRRTIINKLRSVEVNNSRPGFPQIFSNEEEAQFVKCVLKLSEFGFPVTQMELRMVVKSYLARQGRKIARFKDNCPGHEWVLGFTKRHPELSIRLATNIKRSRAAVNECVLREYVEHLQAELKDVPPSNIWNFDETNLTDDPGKKKVLTKRGSKYPENICNSSKSSISVMFAGSAEGEILPPFVVYKSAHLWSTWTENGPIGCLYSNSPSGWFDSNTFTEWFIKLMLPRLKKLEGKKVVICDNLSSHLTPHVLELCSERNISFICLPANSTHITQPLDVSFFGPMKAAWRQILKEWKSSMQGFKDTVLQKQHFPFLLRRLMDIIGINSAKNLIAGFRKCSINPVNVDEILSRLPSQLCDTKAVQDSFIEALQSKRSEWTSGVASNRGRKKLVVTPGKSVTAMKNKVTKKQSSHKLPESSSDEDSEAISLKDSSEDEDYLNSQIRTPSPELFEVDDIQSVTRPKTKSPEHGEFVLIEGHYVIFKYEGEYFPGLITNVCDDGAVISSMQKSKKSWKWPTPKDEMNYALEDIICTIEPPKQISKRGFFSVPELDTYWS